MQTPSEVKRFCNFPFVATLQQSLLLIPFRVHVQMNIMGARQLQNALEKLSNATREVEDVIGAMRESHDPLAVHIFTSRRQYRNVSDTKSGKRRRTAELQHGVRTRLSWESRRMGTADGGRIEAVKPSLGR